MPVKDSLERTRECHSKRPTMKDKWRKIGSPQNTVQKDFVRKFFEPFRYDKDIGLENGFDNHSNYKVFIENRGTFDNAYRALYDYKYGVVLYGLKSITEEKVIIQKFNWDEKKLEYMTIILHNKLEQNETVRTNLMSTCLRPLIKISSDQYWGNKHDDTGKNNHGKLLMKLRDDYFFKLFHTV